MKPRRGSLLFEITISLGLVAVASVAVTQLVVLAAQQRREAEQVRAATREAANLMERAMTLSFEELSESRLAKWTLSAEAARRLPSGNLDVSVTEVPGELRQREIRIVVAWRPVGGPRQIALSAWRFSSPGTAPTP